MTPEEQNEKIFNECGTPDNPVGDYSTCVARIRQENPVTEGSSKMKEHVPWHTVPVDKFGVSVPVNSGTVFRPQQVGTITSPEQVEYIRDINSSFNNYYGVEKSLVPSFYALPKNEQDMFDAAAKSIHPLKTGSSYYGELIDTSYDMSKVGVNRSPQMLAYQQLVGASGSGGSGGSGGGGGGGSKITEYRTIQAEEDVRALADEMAMEMIGRPVSDKEFAKLLKKTRKAEMGRPRIVNGGTTREGLTDEGREQIMRKVLSKKPEWKDYQLSTTAMDAVLGVIKQDRAIAGE